jgi:hypothetical protein
LSVDAVNIREMRTRQRIVGLLTVLAVAWTAMWPVVASARAAFAHEQVMLCHQAGMQVDPSAPVPGQGKTHCPLCIMAFYGAFTPALVASPAFFSVASVRNDHHAAPLAAEVGVHLPQGRAPPR